MIPRIQWGLTAFTFAFRAALAGRYDFFRDELYFIVCGRHPAFGYVDQPPLVPLIAAGTQAFGENLVLMRIVPALLAAGAVFFACSLARLAGGGGFAVLLTGLCVAGTAPMFLGLETTFNTTAHEPLLWTLVAYGIARSVVQNDRRALIWTGAAVGVAAEAKYGVAIWLIGLAIGIGATQARRVLLTPQAAIGVALALAIGLPSVIWQAMHGWPFVDLVIAGGQGKNAVYSPVDFVVGQLLVMNPLLAPVWLAGVAAPFMRSEFTNFRFTAIAYLAALVLLIVTHGKDYYLAPAYPTMFAVGAVAIEQLARPAWLRAPWLRAAWLFCAIALALRSALATLPILPPNDIPAYMAAVHLSEPVRENNQIGAALPQDLGDQVDWRNMVNQVAIVWRALPPEDRARAAIITSNYGEAGAIDFFGAAAHMPPALSGHNAYWAWGTHGYDGSIILRVNGNIELYRKRCRSARIAGYFGGPLAMPYERATPIVLCRGLKRPLPIAWPDFRHYD